VAWRRTLSEALEALRRLLVKFDHLPGSRALVEVTPATPSYPTSHPTPRHVAPLLSSGRPGRWTGQRDISWKSNSFSGYSKRQAPSALR